MVIILGQHNMYRVIIIRTGAVIGYFIYFVFMVGFIFKPIGDLEVNIFSHLNINYSIPIQILIPNMHTDSDTRYQYTNTYIRISIILIQTLLQIP